MLEINSIYKSFGGVRAVDDASLNIAGGQIVGLIGQSGSGKTTLARIIIGLEQSDSGTITFSGRNMQYIFQNALGSFNPKFNLYSSMLQPLRIYGLPADRSSIEELFEAVGLEASMLDRYPSQLSGGQIQRAAIARALAARPDILLADEPTSALDQQNKTAILELLCQLCRSRGMSCLLVSHDILSLRGIADELYIMYRGRIVETDRTERILTAPQNHYTRSLISAAGLKQ